MNGSLVRWPRSRHLRLALCLLFAALGLYALFAGVAAAQGVFDPLETSVKTQSQGWFNTIQGLVTPTFMIVATIEFCWAAVIWAFEKDSLNSLSVEIIKKVMTHGFFYILLVNAGTWVPMIAQSFETVGDTVVGQTISTDTIIKDGLDVIADLWGNVAGQVMLVLSFDFEEIAGTANPFAYAMLDLSEAQLVLTGITSIIIAFAYLVTAAQYFLLKVEAYVLFAAGAVYLGFGGASWGKDYIMKYLNYAINAGLRLLVLTLTLTLTLSVVSGSGAIFAFDIGAELKLMGLAVLQAILAVKGPDMAGGLMGFPGAGLTANGVFSSALNTISQIQMIGMAMRGGMGGAAGGHGQAGGAHGAHDVGRAAGLGNAARGSAPGPSGASSEARNAGASVRGLGDGGQ